MSVEILTMLVGFLTIVLVIVQTNNQTRTELRVEINEFRSELRAEINESRSEFKSDINRLETRLETKIDNETKATNAKLDTLLAGLFRSYLPPEQPKKQDESA